MTTKQLETIQNLATAIWDFESELSESSLSTEEASTLIEDLQGLLSYQNVITAAEVAGTDNLAAEFSSGDEQAVYRDLYHALRDFNNKTLNFLKTDEDAKYFDNVKRMYLESRGNYLKVRGRHNAARS